MGVHGSVRFQSFHRVFDELPRHRDRQCAPLASLSSRPGGLGPQLRHASSAGVEVAERGAAGRSGRELLRGAQLPAALALRASRAGRRGGSLRRGRRRGGVRR